MNPDTERFHTDSNRVMMEWEQFHAVLDLESERARFNWDDEKFGAFVSEKLSEVDAHAVVPNASADAMQEEENGGSGSGEHPYAWLQLATAAYGVLEMDVKALHRFCVKSMKTDTQREIFSQCCTAFSVRHSKPVSQQRRSKMGPCVFTGEVGPTVAYVWFENASTTTSDEAVEEDDEEAFDNNDDDSDISYTPSSSSSSSSSSSTNSLRRRQPGITPSKRYLVSELFVMACDSWNLLFRYKQFLRRLIIERRQPTGASEDDSRAENMYNANRMWNALNSAAKVAYEMSSLLLGKVCRCSCQAVELSENVRSPPNQRQQQQQQQQQQQSKPRRKRVLPAKAA